MKKTIVVFLAVAVLACIGAGIFLYLNKPALSPEDILPEGAVFYARCSDLKSALAEIASSRFWEKIQSVDYDFLVQSTGLRQDQQKILKAVQAQVSDPAFGAVVEKFFGKEFSVAVYPMEFDPSGVALNSQEAVAAALEKLFSNIILVARVDADVRFAETVSSLFGQMGNVETESMKYEGQDVRLLAMGGTGLKVGLVRMKDLLVIGLGDHAARRAIDTYAGKEGALAKDALFQGARDQFEGPWNVKGYVELSKVMGFFKGQIGRLTAQISSEGMGAPEENAKRIRDIQKQWDGIFEQAEAMKMLGFGARAGKASQFKFALFFDKAKVRPGMSVLLTCPPSENKTSAFVPREIVGYQWSNCFDLKEPWEQLAREAAQAQEQGRPVAAQLEQIQNILGVDVAKDIVPVFQGEVGGYLTDIRMGGVFPYPQLVLFVKVKDGLKAKAVLEKLQQHIPVAWQDENYKNVALTYLSAPLMNDVRPGYCFLGDYLLVGINTDLLKGSVDAFQGAAASLTADPLFSEMDFGLNAKGRSVQIFKVDRLAQKSKEVIEWAKAWGSSQDAQRQAFKAGAEKRLEDTKAAVIRKETELAELKVRQAGLEDEIWNINSRGADAGLQQTQLSGLKENIASKEQEVASDREQQAELEKILKGYDRPRAGQEHRDEVLAKTVYPLLESLSSVGALGVRTTLQNDVWEADILLKME